MRCRTEGQILVLFTGGLLLLLAITALVIDVGFILMLRRQEQNGADPGALAAARHINPATDIAIVRAAMRQEACFYALANGFRPRLAPPAAPDLCDPGQPHDGSLLYVNYPPSPSAGQFAGHPGYVEVAISRGHQSFFAGAVGLPNLGVTSSAVAARTHDDSNSTSLLALAPTGCRTGRIEGNTPPSTGIAPKVTVEGSVQVNSSCPEPPPPPQSAQCLSNGSAALVTGGDAGLDAPQVYVVGSCADNGGGAIVTDEPGDGVHQGAAPLGDPLEGLRAPAIDTSQPGGACGGVLRTDATTNNRGCGAGGIAWSGPDCVDDTRVKCVTLSPGVYYGGWNVSNRTRLLLNPGMYIIAGGGIRQTGGGTIESVVGTGNPTEAQIMIYSTDNPLPNLLSACRTAWSGDEWCQQGLNFQATGGAFKAYGLAAYACSLMPDTCPYKGILLWQDGRGSCPVAQCAVQIGGGTSLAISGTVYAPDQAVELLGSTDTSGLAALQIISWTWKITGDSSIYMPWDKDLLYQFEAKGLVK